MTRADSIASHGRVGKVSALSITSFGRLYKAIEEIIVVGVTEIMHLVSKINTTINLISRVDN